MPFLSTLSLRRATPVSRCYHKCIQNFYPRSPCGERRLPICKYGLPLIFLSTLSLRRATDSFRVVVGTGQHFYPRSPCGERPLPNISFITSILLISIHALLAESDGHRSNDNSYDTYFYPRSPCGERRKPCRTKHSTNPFLSTLSLRRATAFWFFAALKARDFYPRSPCGERRYFFHAVQIIIVISIHALLAESDGSHYSSSRPFQRFLSTLSLRRATSFSVHEVFANFISIHALLAESDSVVSSTGTTGKSFLSTLSLRRATGAP